VAAKIDIQRLSSWLKTGGKAKYCGGNIANAARNRAGGADLALSVAIGGKWPARLTAIWLSAGGCHHPASEASNGESAKKEMKAWRKLASAGRLGNR